jgi:hypothetical protein
LVAAIVSALLKMPRTCRSALDFAPLEPNGYRDVLMDQIASFIVE